ncbi:Ca2+-binding RTX toxin-like protein [Amaricoccus macauensis]|uniref:Ca2+-binding RTX toxin-like protein n=1 Tax=Amaricoccus macauensis TaxID=57001 RepID=A0A840SHJ1_9RHOB|nr:calcium-binding protein [Amaricoccus macauensis]MBB5220220.1 Ca2+-binding RTX toxin-like protein [Amaricoccus macauensis]
MSFGEEDGIDKTELMPGRVMLDQFSWGRISPDGDIDYYRVTLDSGRYFVYAGASDFLGGGSAVGVRGTIYDALGTSVGVTGKSLTVTNTQIYTIAVGAQFGGGYALSVNFSDDVGGDRYVGALTATMGTEYALKLDAASDIDSVRLGLTQGQRYFWAVTSEAVSDLRVTLETRAYNPYATLDLGSGGTGILQSTSGRDSTVWLTVSSGGYRQTGAYDLLVSTTMTDDLPVLAGGRGDDALSAQASSEIWGLSGADTLLGSAGADFLNGGDGADSLEGGDGDDRLFGGAQADTLSGGAGNDTLQGQFGSDLLLGGAGDDTFILDDTPDTVIEAETEGTDSVFVLADYVLPDHVENLQLGGSADLAGTGNDLSNLLIGNEGTNALSGNGGNDTLDGGAGDDRMAGGVGDDSYVVDSAGDVVEEAPSAGFDTVTSTIDYVLSANIEALSLSGNATRATGNALDNSLWGNAGANVLDGRAGSDRMDGGAGDDTYFVDSAGDRIIERVGGGNDTIRSNVSHRMEDNVETLMLTGAGNLRAVGTDARDVIFGNAGNNAINGLAGADRMRGGAGNDTYVVDNTRDVVIETPTGGSDAIRSTVSYRLGANVETLVLLGTAISARGNGGDNLLRGNASDNSLEGGGGRDVLVGGGGADSFVFREDAAGVRDVIRDFTPGLDKIVLGPIDADVWSPGNQAFTFIGTAGFSGVAGELRATHRGLLGDVDGDRVADYDIAFSAPLSITETDLVL